MFGYIKVNKPELKLRDWEDFSGYYCGLCRGLKKYSEKSRLLLSYDVTFLYIVLSGLARTEQERLKKRCVMHPTKKRLMIAGDAADYCAAINIMLGVANLADKYSDDKNFAAMLSAAALKKDCKKAAHKYPESYSAIKQSVDELEVLERENCADIDRAADCFAAMLGQIFRLGGAEIGVADTSPLFDLGYNIGRWIYLIDAFDDAKDDAKTGNYNPFNAKFCDDTVTMQQSAKFNINASLAAACSALDRLTFNNNERIIDNIVRSALYVMTKDKLNEQ